MSIYIYSIVILFISSIIAKKAYNPRKAFCIVNGVQLTVIQALRNYRYVGVDLLRYCKTYEATRNAIWKEVLNIRNGSSFLYYFINGVFSKIGVSFQFFIATVSIFCVAVTVMYIYRYSSNCFIGFMIYLGLGLYTFQFSGLKQSLAMAFSLICIMVSRDGKKYLSLLFFIIALLLHPTAIVIIPLFVLLKFKLNRKTILFFILFLIGAYFERMRIGRLITAVVMEDYVGAYVSKINLGGTAILYIIILIIFLLVERNNHYSENRNMEDEYAIDSYSYDFYVLFMSITVQLCSSYSYAFTRVNLYYVPLLSECVSHLLKISEWKVRIRQPEFVKIVFILLLSMLLIFLFFSHIHGEMLDTYKFFWNY